MKNIALRKALWRSRAVAIIGFLIILVAIFNGPPGVLRSTLLIVLGVLTLAFGFAGSRHKSYSETENEFKEGVKESLSNEQIYPVVEDETSVPLVQEDNNE